MKFGEKNEKAQKISCHGSDVCEGGYQVLISKARTKLVKLVTHIYISTLLCV